MNRMFWTWPMGVTGGGSGWMCAITATAVVALVIFLFASGEELPWRRSR